MHIEIENVIIWPELEVYSLENMLTSNRYPVCSFPACKIPHPY